MPVNESIYRSSLQNGSRREMGHSAPAWAMHVKRQSSMHGPAGLTQIEKKSVQVCFQMGISN